MSALGRLLMRGWARAFGLVHAGGVVLLALAVATEAADEPWPELGRRLAADVPHAWALLSPALSLVAAALAMRRLRGSGELLVLGTLGVSLRRVRLSVLAPAALVAVAAAAVGRVAAPRVEVARLSGGWLVSGVVLPDPGSPLPDAAAVAAARFGAPWDWPGTAVLLVVASAAGAALGVRGQSWSVLVAAATCVVVDVLRRGSEPEHAGGWLAGLCVLGVALSAGRDAR